jgi:hypothetical protein
MTQKTNQQQNLSAIKNVLDQMIYKIDLIKVLENKQHGKKEKVRSGNRISIEKN